MYQIFAFCNVFATAASAASEEALIGSRKIYGKGISIFVFFVVTFKYPIFFRNDDSVLLSFRAAASLLAYLFFIADETGISHYLFAWNFVLSVYRMLE